jgi:CHAT domain
MSASNSVDEETDACSVNSSYVHDLLTVFQAAPLVSVDHSGDIHPIHGLDFETERLVLRDALRDSQVHLAFDIATFDRLNAFLARGEGRVLHFSCHGNPNFLAIEDGWGELHDLQVEDLRGWIKAGGQSLQFVFVSACHSRTTGEAFIQAGVPHVVCCQQDDVQIRNVAAVDFARAFYHALACGKALKEAFELARQQVLNSPQLDRHQRQVEGNKFVLLPESGNHDVQIFQPENAKRTRALEHRSPTPSPGSNCYPSPSSTRLPLPPHVFEGRQADMYRVMDALRQARLVRVTGPEGIGKASVVKAVCQYMQDRAHILGYQVAWVPTLDAQDDDVTCLLTKMHDMMAGEEHSDSAVLVFARRIIGHLHSLKHLIVFDARQFPKMSFGMQRLTTFLRNLVQSTLNIKIIVIHHVGELATASSFACIEKDIYLKPLDLRSTVNLFTKLCNHVTERKCHDHAPGRDLLDFLDCETASAKPTSGRSREIYRRLGEGNPTRIDFFAKTMDSNEYDRLIKLVQRKEQPLEFRSRAELEFKLAQLRVDIEQAIQDKAFLRAQECQEIIDEMGVAQESLPDLASLESMADSTSTDQELAIQARDFLTAARLQEQLDALRTKINVERRALTELGGVIETYVAAATDEEEPMRAELDAEINKLEVDLSKASDENDFDKAREIDARIKLLETQRDLLPSTEMLLCDISQLRDDLKRAKGVRQWDVAESIFASLQNREKRLRAEQEAERRLGLLQNEKRAPNLSPDAPGAVAVHAPRREFAWSDVEDDSDAADDLLPVAMAIAEDGELLQMSTDIDRRMRRRRLGQFRHDNEEKDGDASLSGFVDSVEQENQREQEEAMPSTIEYMSNTSEASSGTVPQMGLQAIPPRQRFTAPSVSSARRDPMGRCPGRQPIQNSHHFQPSTFLQPQQMQVQSEVDCASNLRFVDEADTAFARNINSHQTYTVQGHTLQQMVRDIRQEVISNSVPATMVVAINQESELQKSKITRKFLFGGLLRKKGGAPRG